MDLVHYSEGIPPAMRSGYIVLVLLCRHYSVLKGLSFVVVAQVLAISQTCYITRSKSDTAHNPTV